MFFSRVFFAIFLMCSLLCQASATSRFEEALEELERNVSTKSLRKVNDLRKDLSPDQWISFSTEQKNKQRIQSLGYQVMDAITNCFRSQDYITFPLHKSFLNQTILYFAYFNPDMKTVPEGLSEETGEDLQNRHQRNVRKLQNLCAVYYTMAGEDKDIKDALEKIESNYTMTINRTSIFQAINENFPGIKEHFSLIPDRIVGSFSTVINQPFMPYVASSLIGHILMGPYGAVAFPFLYAAYELYEDPWVIRNQQQFFYSRL